MKNKKLEKRGGIIFKRKPSENLSKEQMRAVIGVNDPPQTALGKEE